MAYFAGMIPGANPNEWPGQYPGEQALPSPVSGIYVLPTPTLWPDYRATWQNGITTLVIALTDNDVPLLAVVSDSPPVGTATKIAANQDGDLAGATSLTFIIRALSGSPLLTYVGLPIDFETAATVLLASDVAALGIGFFDVSVQVVFSGGPKPVFRGAPYTSNMQLQITSPVP